MEFQTLKRSHLKKNIIIGVLVIGIIGAVVLNFTRAKYRTTQSIPLVNGTINYSLADLNIVAITIDGKEVDSIPEGNYELTDESYCTVNGEIDSNIKLSYDSATKGLSVTPMTTKGTKCYLDFKTATTKKVDTILGQIEVNLDTPDFNKTSCSSGCGEATVGIYEGEDEDGTTYYYRGDVDNNWVRFAGYYWRIIRINGDGSIRLIYNGTSTATTGTSTMISSSQAFNSSSNRSEYVGYMYTTSSQHGNTTDSPIKDVLDSWYSSNLASYANQISTEAGFCGDREMASGYSWSSTGSTHYYAGYGRLAQNSNGVNPTFKCSNSNDLYTTSTSSKGNKKLSNPIGLITVDEVVMAGGAWNSGNSSYYLYNNAAYWTMSPFYFNVGSGGSWAIVFGMRSTGNLDAPDVSNADGVRPVINLARDVEIIGSGTSSDPYVVVV